MRERLRRISSTTLAAYIAIVDATLWLAALPLELSWQSFVTHAHPSALVLAGMLAANLLLLGLILSAAAATCELVRRGLTRPVPALLRALAPQRSRRSVR